MKALNLAIILRAKIYAATRWRSTKMLKKKKKKKIIQPTMYKQYQGTTKIKRTK